MKIFIFLIFYEKEKTKKVFIEFIHFLLLLSLIKFFLFDETLGDGFHVDFGNPYLKGGGGLSGSGFLLTNYKGFSIYF